MKTVTIGEGREFKIESTGNGTFYTLTHKPTGKSTFFQGDDAAEFRAMLDSAERAFPTYSQDQIGAFLWCDCEYGSVAQHRTVRPWGEYCDVASRRVIGSLRDFVL